MNKRIRQLSEARRWIVVIVMLPLIISGIYISSAFPSHAFSKEAATATLKSWKVVASPNVGASDNSLTKVAVVSTNDVWAVGYYRNYSTRTDQTLIEHWNGSAWRVVPSPSIGTSDNSLGGVAIVSASNIWAVGYYRNTTINKVQTLIEHYS